MRMLREGRTIRNFRRAGTRNATLGTCPVLWQWRCFSGLATSLMIHSLGDSEDLTIGRYVAHNQCVHYPCSLSRRRRQQYSSSFWPKYFHWCPLALLSVGSGASQWQWRNGLTTAVDQCGLADMLWRRLRETRSFDRRPGSLRLSKWSQGRRRECMMANAYSKNRSDHLQPGDLDLCEVIGDVALCVDHLSSKRSEMLPEITRTA
jgi:hypothetical protein